MQLWLFDLNTTLELCKRFAGSPEVTGLRLRCHNRKAIFEKYTSPKDGTFHVSKELLNEGEKLVDHVDKYSSQPLPLHAPEKLAKRYDKAFARRLSDLVWLIKKSRSRVLLTPSTKLVIKLRERDKGLNFLHSLVPEDRAKAKENINNIVNGKPFENVEYTAIRKDGLTFSIMTYTSPIIKDRKIAGLRGIIVDISERKRMEEELLKIHKIDPEAKIIVSSGYSNDPVMADFGKYG